MTTVEETDASRRLTGFKRTHAQFMVLFAIRQRNLFLKLNKVNINSQTDGACRSNHVHITWFQFVIRQIVITIDLI